MSFVAQLPDLAGLAKAQAAASASASASAGTSAAAAAWRKRLKPASFRGVAFEVDSDEQRGGRRTVTHEFPGRDTPYAEDLGRKARTYAVTAYVLGAAYMAARDDLLAALEAEGPGALIVPWMPERQVICTEYSKAESAAEGGMARFELTFADRGSESAPSASPLPGVKASSAADAAARAAGAVLDSTVTIAGVPVAVQASALAQLREIGSLLSRASAVARTAADFPAALAKLQNLTLADFVSALPSELAGPLFDLDESYAAFASAYATSSGSGDSAALRERAEALFAANGAEEEAATPVGAGAVRSRIAANGAAVSAYRRAMAVTEACRAAALVTPASQAEAAALRGQVIDAVDAALERDPETAVAAALVDLRAATLRAVAAAAGQAPEVATVSTAAVLPAYVVAQRAVVSPGYAPSAPEAAAQLLARNGVRHPGFVPAGGLEVLRAL